jgi:hypothetical protein
MVHLAFHRRPGHWHHFQPQSFIRSGGWRIASIMVSESSLLTVPSFVPTGIPDHLR